MPIQSVERGVSVLDFLKNKCSVVRHIIDVRETKIGAAVWIVLYYEVTASVLMVEGHPATFVAVSVCICCQISIALQYPVRRTRLQRITNELRLCKKNSVHTYTGLALVVHLPFQLQCVHVHIHRGICSCPDNF